MMRIALFLLTNLAVMVVFGLVLSLTGIQSSSVQGLMIMALLFGFGGSFVSLLMSKWMALRSVGGEVIEGFYLLEDDTLVLGPFQGKIACVRIPVGRGVCGTAVARNQVQRIEDVHVFDGHIACDAASNSEIVLPLVVKNQIIGVLDIDSTVFGRFTDEDEQGLRQLVAQLEKVLATTDYKKFFASVAG